MNNYDDEISCAGRGGQVQMLGHFNTPLTEPVTMLVFFQFEQTYIIDLNKKNFVEIDDRPYIKKCA